MIEFTTEQFSGPLGLLLSLIEKEEMDITDINLAKIADQYVEHIRQTDNINPEEMADFLLIASRLLFAKSKALLPYLSVSDEEDGLDELEKQLKMYREFVLASKKVEDIIAKKPFLFLPPLAKSRPSYSNLPVFSAPGKLTAVDLRDKLIEVASKLETQIEEKLPEKKLEAKISIEEKIAFVKKMLLEKIRFSFSKLLSNAKNKTEVIVSFLAVLELAKQKELVFEQDDIFSDIYITRNS